MLLLQYTLMFTDFIADPVTRHTYGYYFLYIVGVLIILNIVVLVVSLTIGIRQSCRRMRF